MAVRCVQRRPLEPQVGRGHLKADAMSAYAKASFSTLLASCEAERIEVPGAIQPHGLLLGVDPEGLIAYASANAGANVEIKLETLRKGVDSFRSGSGLIDDVTMVMCEFDKVA